jgi:hypothetical protein
VTGFKVGSKRIYIANNAMLDFLGLAESAQLCNAWKMKVTYFKACTAMKYYASQT